MNTIIRALFALITAVLMNFSTGNAQTFWSEPLQGNPVFGDQILSVSVSLGDTREVTVQANMGPGLTVEELLLDMPWYYSVGAVSGNFGDPIIGMGNFASPIVDVRFPTKVSFWGGDPFDENDSITFRREFASPPVVPTLTGLFSADFLVVPPNGPNPGQWLAMALVNYSYTGESGWVGVCVPVPEPANGVVFIAFLLIFAVVARFGYHLVNRRGRPR